jgi:hypothetical protein
MHFLNTNKPSRKPERSCGQPSLSTTVEQKQKMAFEKIVIKCFDEMEDNTEYENDVEDETRRKFSQEFQKLKLDLHTSFLD